MTDYLANEVSQEAVAAASLVMALNEDEETLNHDMIEGETGFFEAVEKALDEIADCEIQEVGISDMIKRLSERKSRVKKRIEKLRGLIDQSFQIAGVKSHKFPCATITTKAIPRKVIVVDEAEIPSRFYTPQPPKLDLKALKDALPDNAVKGAILSNGGTTIQIRRT